MRLALLGLPLGLVVHAAAAQGASPLVADREANAQLTSIVSATREAGLPIEPILSKVQYGVVVAHAPPTRIVAAARAIAARLETARQALAPQPSDADIINGADALGAGVEPKGLQAIRAASPRQSVAVPLGVLAQLVSSGVEAPKAIASVIELIKRGASPQQFVALGSGVNSDIASGERAANALDVRLRGLNAVLAPGGAGVAAAADAPGITTGAQTGPKKP
jgi:hypothetical protein